MSLGRKLEFGKETAQHLGSFIYGYLESMDNAILLSQHSIGVVVSDKVNGMLPAGPESESSHNVEFTVFTEH